LTAAPGDGIFVQVPLSYQSGERIRPGDRVRIHGEAAEIESVHDPLEDPEDWYVQQYGGGVMVLAPGVFGRLFIKIPVGDCEDLEFVSRSA
jgi:hypothetical protein